MKGKVYVVNAYVPNGGTLMAYHMAVILHRDFGYEVCVLTDRCGPDHGIFVYEPVFETKPLADIDKLITARDILICNPSFSTHNFGLRFDCLKIMYVQGFTTFSLIDRFFDHYVSVSGFVQNFLSSTYDLHTRVIPPFISLNAHSPALGWLDRPEGSLALNLKGSYDLQSLLLERIRQRMTIIAPQVEAGIDWEKALQLSATKLPHGDMLRRLGEVRYLLSLAVGEGFGLVPLEAMGMGTTVVGFDGFGGRDYVRHGDNCTLRAYPDIDGVADDLVRVLTDTGYAQSVARKGHETANLYTYERFRAAWIEEFQQAFRRKGF